MTPRKPISAADLVSELEGNTAYLHRRAMLSERSAREVAEDQAALVQDLAAAGISVNSVYDFVTVQPARVTSGRDFDKRIETPIEAVPVLLRHLERRHLPVVREGLLRALSRPHLRDAALVPLMRLFQLTQDSNERWLIANAISSMARFKDVSELSGIAEYRGLFKKTPGKHRAR